MSCYCEESKKALSDLAHVSKTISVPNIWNNFKILLIGNSQEDFSVHGIQMGSDGQERKRNGCRDQTLEVSATMLALKPYRLSTVGSYVLCSGVRAV